MYLTQMHVIYYFFFAIFKLNFKYLTYTIYAETAFVCTKVSDAGTGGARGATGIWQLS